jgi:RNA recognition motif-containing protein
MSTKLHVGNIRPTVLEDDLQATFAKFGPVDTVEIARDPSTLVSKDFATVAMARDEEYLSE